MRRFDYDQYIDDIKVVVRAMDNVIDRTIYPLPEQQREAQNKRRMGLGVTGLANAAEMLGYPYASQAFKDFTSMVLSMLRDVAYDEASSDLAAEKGLSHSSVSTTWARSTSSDFLSTSKRRSASRVFVTATSHRLPLRGQSV